MSARPLRWLLPVALVAMALAFASASLASPKLRSCGLNGNSYVSATRNVSCRTAIRIDHDSDAAHGCSLGHTCHPDGYTCRMRSASQYAFRETCTRGREREVLVTGGS